LFLENEVPGKTQLIGCSMSGVARRKNEMIVIQNLWERIVRMPL
jgi:hypothetical protein